MERKCFNLNIQFSKQLKALREEKNLTLEELSKKTQIGIEKLKSFENGSSIPSTQTILILSNALEVPVSNLVDGLKT